MYKYSNGRISLADFRQPVGMHLNADNRWVKKAQTIPWSEIEQRYAARFVNRKGNVAKPLRLALRAYILQAEYGFSDEETAQMMQEHPYFQYFCGYPGYDDEHLPFDPSLMVYFRKRLTPEILGEINELILYTARKGEHRHDDDGDRGNGGNRGTMIVDATCAPSNIRYPQDASLLNEARENSCAIWRETLPLLTKSLLWAEPFLGGGTTVSRPSARSMSSKNTCMTTAVTRSRTGLSASASHFSAPLWRGKAVEFGAKLDISVVDGWTRLECFSFDAYNEAGNLQDMAERFCQWEGHYPSRILADKIYRNRENLRYCKERGIHLSGPTLGRPKKDEVHNKTRDFLDECERVEVERRFRLAKRKCRLGLIVTKLRETIAHSVAMSILVLNLRKIQRDLLRLLALLALWMLPQEKGPLFS